MGNIRLTHRRTRSYTNTFVGLIAGISTSVIMLCFPRSAQSAIPQQERDALVALFNKLGGINWTTKTGWLGPRGSECTWYGVTCDAAQASVIGVDLSGNGVMGRVPAEIGNLTNLQTLKMNADYISSLPDEVGNLTNLQILELGDNTYFVGLPSTMGNLSQLQVLLVSGGWIGGSIPAELGNLKQLRSLRIINYGHYYHQMGFTGSIPPELGNLTNLQILELDGNRLSGGIPAELGNLKNLKALNLSGNTYGGLGGSIPSSLGLLQNLQSLKLRSNGLRGDIPSTLFDLVNLQELDLGANYLTNIPTEIAGLTNLRVLHWCCSGLTSVPAELGSLTNLQDLDLQGNNLSAGIPAELGNLVNLQTLGLGFDQLSSIPAALGKLTNLQSLNLSYNSLDSIPDELRNLIQLLTLNLSNNKFGESVPAALSGLTSLRLLDLSFNQLKSIPAELGDLRNLVTLDLSNNQLSSGIPSSFGTLTSLETLRLDGNQLTGAIPSSLGNLTKLNWLRAEGNNLSGSIPRELGNLRNLQYLELGGNQLSGIIPVELGNLTNLVTLELSGNHLSGSIPSELGNLTNLWELGISNNELSGGLPPSLGNLKNLRHLNVAGNKLSGAIPPALAFISELFLDLGYNALYANDSNLRTFVNSRAMDWDKTQTVAPSDAFAIFQPDSSTLVSWQPIPFTDYEGRYEVWARTPRGEPYVLVGSTANKSSASLALTNLSPGTMYFLVVRAVTDPNPNNQNTVVSDFSAEFTVGIPTVSQSFPLNNGGAATSSTYGSTGATQAGYAAVTLKPDSAPYGTAVFSYMQNGVTVSECGVPASPPTTAVRFFVDFRTGTTIPGSEGKVDIYTGFAAVNRGDGPATITVTLRDLSGQTITSGTGNLAKGAHIVKYIHQLADILSGFSIPSSFPTANGYGTLELTSNQPLSVVALRLTLNQRGETLLTSTPIADLTQRPTNTPIYFPQIADGGGYTTTVILLNTSNAVETGAMRLFDAIGSPLTVNQLRGTSGASFDYSISPGGAFVFQTDASPAATNVGWMELTPGEGTSVPVGAGIFQFSQSGTLLTESGIPSATPTTHARIYVDLSGGHRTGLALGNPGDLPISISLAAFQMDGTSPIGTSNWPVSLGGKWHSALFVDQMISYLPADFRGVLDFVSDSPFAALTLRCLVNERSDFLMATFPVADLNRRAPFPVVFPQIADGGGYRTEFILLGTGQSSSATIAYFGDGGTPIAVGH